MKKCVESGPVTPMQREWAHKIVQMIPERLRSTPYLKECINDLFDEIKVDFNSSMKKSMGKIITSAVHYLNFQQLFSSFVWSGELTLFLIPDIKIPNAFSQLDWA